MEYRKKKYILRVEDQNVLLLCYLERDGKILSRNLRVKQFIDSIEKTTSIPALCKSCDDCLFVWKYN